MSSESFLREHSNPYIGVFIDIAKSKNAMIQPQLPMWYEYEQDMRSAFESCWLGKETAKEALETVQVRMQDKLDRILKVRRLREGK
jgi:maltose-binding protein MalE